MEDVRVQKQHSCISITSLPDLPLDLIFGKLNKQHDQKSFGLTCHRFLEVQNLSQKHLRIRNCSSDLDSCMLDKLLNRFSKLQDLSLANCWELSDSDLTKLQKYGSTLQCLSLASCCQVTDIGLISVASYCPMLSVISLFSCSITDSGIEVLAKSCKSLIEASLASCVDITDCGIQYISQYCHQLRALNIRECIEIDGVGLKGCSSTLAILEANYWAFDSTGIIEILSGGSLEYLNLSCPDYEHTMVQILKSLI